MDQERLIEKLLHRFKKKRLDEASGTFTIHPATRKLLQGEVAQQFRKPGSPARSAWWPILGWALPLILVGGLALWLTTEKTDRRNPTLALSNNYQAKEPSPPETLPAPDTTPLAKALVPTPVPMPPPPRSEATDEVQFAKANALRETAKTETPVSIKPEPPLGESRRSQAPPDAINPVTPPPPSSTAPSTSVASQPPPTTDQLALTGDQLNQSSTTMRGFYDSAPSTVRGNGGAGGGSRAISGSNGRSGFGGGGGGGRRAGRQNANEAARALAASEPSAPSPVTRQYNYSRVPLPDSPKNGSAYSVANTRARAAVAAPTQSPVLDSFRIEEDGPSFRVIDADGSTYIGGVWATGTDRLATDKKKETAAATTLPATSLTNFIYRVSGTNLTRKVPIVFTWSFVVPTNGRGLGNTNSALTAKPAVSDGTGPFPLGMPISGQVFVNGQPPTPLQAEPAAP